MRNDNVITNSERKEVRKGTAATRFDVREGFGEGTRIKIKRLAYERQTLRDVRLLCNARHALEHHGRLATRATKFCTVAPNIFESSV
jgi:hypothetical protein